MELLSQLLCTLSHMLDLSDKGHLHHGERVALLAGLLAKEILPHHWREVFFAGLVHDLGAVGAPYHVTQYAGLEAQKREPVVRAHPLTGAQLVRLLPRFHILADFILEHHERWDGRGYPYGKKKDEVSLGAQILHIADEFDLRLRHKYKGALPPLSKFFPPQSVNRAFSRENRDLLIQLLSRDNLYQRICDDKQMVTLFDQMSESAAKYPIKLLDESDLDLVLVIFARVIDAKHEYTHRHSERISLYSQRIARTMGLSQETIETIGRAGLVHDAGKIAVPRAILDAPRRLEPQEFEIIKSHPLYTMELLDRVEILQPLAPIAGYHHERYDGQGYPKGLKGEEIPLPARIMAVCDAFDAMTSARPYQQVRTALEAVNVLRENAGTQFDPQVVKAAETEFGYEVVP